MSPTGNGIDPVAFPIGNIDIYWYSLCILLAFLVGFFLVKFEAKKHFKIKEDWLYDYLFFLIPIVIIGARLYYVIFEWGAYQDNLLEIINIRNGGLAIHGGVIAGLIYTIFYTRKHKINTFRFMDLIVPSLVLGQAIGRWGNFFNGEAYGPVTTLEFLHKLHLPQFIIDGMNIYGLYRQPTFLYESLTCFGCFIILFLLRRYYKNLKVGLLCGIYFIIYGIERFFVEGLRTDSLMLGNFKVAQLVSILMIIIGIIFIIMSFIKKVPYVEPDEKEEEKEEKKIDKNKTKKNNKGQEKLTKEKSKNNTTTKKKKGTENE